MPLSRSYRTVNATSSGIHNDDVAQSIGYERGLVTGHAMMAYIIDHAHNNFPGRWESAGSLRIWFSRPVYDGDEIVVDINPDTGLVAVRTDGPGLRATGKIGDLADTVFSGSRRDFTSTLAAISGAREAPTPRLLTPEVAASTDELESIEFVVDEDVYRNQLITIGLDPTCSKFVDATGLAYLYRQYVPFSRANFESDEEIRPIIHVGSELEWYRPVAFGETLSVRGRVDRAYSRKGVHYLVMELSWYDSSDDSVLRALHTMIYAIAPERTMLAV
jgi:hypothetical protein